MLNFALCQCISFPLSTCLSVQQKGIVLSLDDKVNIINKYETLPKPNVFICLVLCGYLYKEFTH